MYTMHTKAVLKSCLDPAPRLELWFVFALKCICICIWSVFVFVFVFEDAYYFLPGHSASQLELWSVFRADSDETLTEHNKTKNIIPIFCISN